MQQRVVFLSAVWILQQVAPTIEQQQQESQDCLCTQSATTSQQLEMEGGEEEDKFVTLFGGVLQVPHDYNKNLQPPGNPSQVDIGFIVNDILEINDNDYTVSMKVCRTY